MMKWLIGRKLSAFEKKYDYDTSYIRELLDIDFKAFLAYLRAARIGAYKRDVPGIVHSASGSSSQPARTAGRARSSGFRWRSNAGIRRRSSERCSRTTWRGCRRTCGWASASRAPCSRTSRGRRSARGDRGALGAARAPVAGVRGERGPLYPTIKYAMGHGKACQRVQVGDLPVAVVRGAA